MNSTDVILNTPEKFNSAEIKNALLAKFPDAVTHSTSNRCPDLYIIYTVDIWNWLQQYYIHPNNISTFTGVGDWEGKHCIEIPFAG